MIGGLMKTTSRLAMVAAAGLMMGGFALSAKAADLGGDCCADLEERVAELEATTVRKGNRKVSLELSGQVNRALLVWDDGIDSDAFVVDNDFSSTRFRMKGSGTMKPGWKAGFLIEIAVTDENSESVSNFGERDDFQNDTRLQTRHANWYIESEKYGRVTLGQGSAATDDLGDITLGGGLSSASLYAGSGFFLRSDNGTGDEVTSLTWGVLADVADPTARGDYIRYDTPSIYGFILSTAWGEDDFWDIALRFQKEWNSLRIAAGVGYSYDGDDESFRTADKNLDVDVDRVFGSASIMHVPSGVYLSVAGGIIERNSDELDDLDVDADEGEWYYAQLGITKKWTSYGATTLFVEYGQYNDTVNGLGFNSTGTDGSIANIDSIVTGSEVTRYGFGVTQAFDSAALELYANFTFLEADIESVGDEDAVAVDSEDAFFGLMGARIKF